VNEEINGTDACTDGSLAQKKNPSKKKRASFVEEKWVLNSVKKIYRIGQKEFSTERKGSHWK
jgi:hypothetical protein